MEEFEKAIKLHNLQKALHVETDFDQPIEKALGEGSRGGKVIGHTKSGKPIYDNPDKAHAEAVSRGSQRVEEMKRNANHPIHAKLDKFLSQFPDDAKSWKDATDEVRDLARSAKEHINEYDLDVSHDDKKAHMSLDFTKIKTPAEWNKQGKKYIKDAVAKMSTKTKDAFMKEHSDWLNKAVDDEFEKSRSGIYKPTKENLKQGRAGERYGNMINGGSTQNMETNEKDIKDSFKNFIQKFASGQPYIGDWGSQKNYLIIPFNASDDNIRKETIKEIQTNRSLNEHLAGVDSIEGKIGFHPEKLNSVIKVLRKSIEDTIYKAFDNDLLSKDVFEKGFGKKAQLGEVREWHGVRMKKVSETGNSKQDWQPVKEDKGPKQEEKKVDLNDSPSEDVLTEHAKNSSEAAISAAIKESPDPKVRQIAHAELQRRKKEETPQEEKETFPKKQGEMPDSEQKKEEKKPESKEKSDSDQLKKKHDLLAKHRNELESHEKKKGQNWQERTRANEELRAKQLKERKETMSKKDTNNRDSLKKVEEKHSKEWNDHLKKHDDVDKKWKDEHKQLLEKHNKEKEGLSTKPEIRGFEKSVQGIRYF